MKRMSGWLVTGVLAGSALVGLVGCKPSEAVRQGQLIGKGTKEKAAVPASTTALDPATLATIAREHVTDVRIADDLRGAVELARALGSPILVAGSLFIVGEARVAYLGAPADPIAVSDPPASTS